MTKIKILISDEIDLSGIEIFIPSEFLIEVKPNITNEKILKDYSDYNVLILRSTRQINSDFLGKCNFKIIATCSRGTDNIDTAFAKKKRIKIINSTGANAISAAEHTIALILAIFKNLSFSEKLIKKGKFNSESFKRNEIFEKKIGIIGIGQVGNIVASYCSSLGMNVIANDIDFRVKEKYPHLNFSPINYLLENSDIITIHIPLNKKNFHFIGKKKLEKLSENAVFINTSRGNVVDEAELIKLLKSGKIRFAGLDVFENEPYINKELLKLSNVLLTNHIAGKTIESKVRISNDIFKQICDNYKKQ